MRVELTNVTRRYLIEPAQLATLNSAPVTLLPAIPSRGWLIKYVLYNHADDSTPHVGSPVRYIEIIAGNTTECLVDRIRADAILAADASTHVAMPIAYEVGAGTGVRLASNIFIGVVGEPLEVIIVADKLML